MTFSNIIQILALLTTALMAGLFYSYSCSVNPGLGRLSDAEYLTAMQSINRAILNPLFYICFFGALVLLPLNAYLQFHPHSLKFMLLAGAAALYIIGLFGVTVVGNVPLNNMLDGVDLSNVPIDKLASIRKSFEGPWNQWHTVRTIAVFISLLLAITGSIMPEK